jgi:predicted nucleotide-binding protein
MSPALPSLLLVDDDPYQLALLTRYLNNSRFQIATAGSVTKVMTMIEEKEFDLIVMDVMMPDEGLFPGMDSHSGWETGVPLAGAIRRRRPGIKIIAYTNSSAVEIQDWFSRDETVAYLSKKGCSRRLLLRTVDRLLGFPREHPQIFIVHGRDRAVAELKNYLQNTLKLGEPIVLAEQPVSGKTLIEKFEGYAEGTEVAFVLLTPDDEGGLAGASEPRQLRARQNVIFELGYFFGYLKRSSGRVIVLHKGPLEMLSDLKGIGWIDISNGIPAAGEEIRRELREWL